MTRPIVGYVERRGGKPAFVRLTIPGLGRQRIPLPVGCSEALAEERRALYSQMARDGKLVAAETRAPAEPGETSAAYASRWIAARKARGLSNTKTDAHRLRAYVLPALPAGIGAADVTREHVRAVVEHLDDLVGGDALAWKTAKNIWGLVSKMTSDMANGKIKALRIRNDNPALGVRGPDAGAEVASAYLFPKEALTLFGCDAVPLPYRTLYAVALCTGLRLGELTALRVADVVLAGGYVTVHHAYSRELDADSTTKGKRARRVPIELALRPLLETLTAGRAGTEALLDVPTGAHSERLREHLLLAGVDREELHAERTRLRRPLAFHDLRHSFATWLALRGEPALVIQSRLGHADAKTTALYIAAAEELGREDVGTPFPPLPAAQVATRSGHRREGTRLFGRNMVGAQGFEPEESAQTRRDTPDPSSETGSFGEANSAESGPVATSVGHLDDAIEGLRRALSEDDYGRLRVAANDVVAAFDRRAA